MKKSKILALALVSTLASAPAMAWDNNTAGTLIGGAGGAVVGSQFGKGNGKLVGVAIGTLLGAGIGSWVGQSMDYHRPQVAYRETYREEWREPRRYGYGHNKWKHRRHYEPRYVQRTIYSNEYAYAEPEATRQYCREYTTPVVVGGVRSNSYGTACYMPDGSWQVQNSSGR